jgi:hypothetical protein
MTSTIHPWTLRVSLFALALSFATPAVVASSKPVAALPIDASCRQVVRSFYDWYVPRSNILRGNPESDALRYKKSVFSPRLYRALDAERRAQARSTRIVGLDADPFLGAQFTSTHYDLGGLHFTNHRCFVPVYFTSPDRHSDSSSVVTELGLQNGQWVFVNFHYGTAKNDDLLSILRSFGFGY